MPQAAGKSTTVSSATQSDLNAVGASGQLLDASQFVGIGLTVLTRSQYLDILPSSPI